MAKLPDYTALGNLSQPEPSRAIPHYSPAGLNYTGPQGGEAWGKALQKIGGELSDFAATEKNKADKLQQAEADTSFQIANLKTASELERDPDYETRPEKYSAAAGQALEQSAARIADPTQRELFKQRHMPSIAKGTERFNQARWSEQGAAALDKTETELNDLMRGALTSQDEEVRVSALETARRRYEGLAEAGYMSKADAAKRSRMWTERYAVSAIEAMPPEKRMELFDKVMPAQGDGALTTNRRAARIDALPVGKIIDEEARAAGVPPTLAKVYADIESSGRADAVTGSYKGLFQLSDAEFRKYGSGDIFDARDNARAGIAALKDKAAKFEEKYGRAPSPTEIYLLHQQGEGGLGAHLANPDRPAWESMASTAEGRQKGERWAKLAIWGNVPSDMKARFPGGVESVTSRQFMQIWSEKVGETGASQARPKTGTLVDFIEPSKIPLLRRRAESEFRSDQNRRDSEAAADKYRLTSALEDDVAAVSTTGTLTDRVDPEQVRQKLGPMALQQWQERRDAAHTIWTSSHDFATLPDSEIAARVEALAPKPDQPGFIRQQEVYKAVGDRAAATMKDRREDPAGSVDGDPVVQQATKALQANPDDAAARKAVIEARIAVQQKARIANPSPITKAEAMELTAPMERMLPGQERSVLREIGQKAREQYGEHADEAFAYALRARKVSAEAGRIAGRIFKSLQNDEVPARSDLRALDEQGEVDAAKRAIAGDQPRYKDPAYAAELERLFSEPKAAPAPEDRTSIAPAGAIKSLRADPNLAEQFDAKYGKGTAKKILEQFRIR